MQSEQVVARTHDSRHAELTAKGWVAVAHSWAAQLYASDVDANALAVLVRRGQQHSEIREITKADLPTVLALDAATLADYPGGIATQHAALTATTARPTTQRRGFGAFDQAGRAVAASYIDLDGPRAETDFTVVATAHRGLGLGSAVKAASVLTLLHEGVQSFRTGGAAENAAVRATNRRLGYVIDEEWVTLAPPQRRC